MLTEPVIIRTFVPDSRIIYVELQLPDDVPVGYSEVSVAVLSATPIPEPVIPNEVWEQFLRLPDLAFTGGPTDLADRHDDYLYDEL